MLHVLPLKKNKQTPIGFSLKLRHSANMTGGRCNTGPDRLIGGTMKIPSGRVWFLGCEGWCSVVRLGWCHGCCPRAACARSPLTECTLADDIITIWLQPRASLCPIVFSSQRCLLEDAESKLKMNGKRKGGRWKSLFALKWKWWNTEWITRLQRTVALSQTYILRL